MSEKAAVVGVVGGRNYADYVAMKAVLDGMAIGVVVSGGCTGADELAYRYAMERGIEFIGYPPTREDKALVGYGAACLRRNKRIVDRADVIVAFPTAGSRGTYHTIGVARKANKKVIIVDEERENHE